MKPLSLCVSSHCVWAVYYKQIRKSEQRPPLHLRAADLVPQPRTPCVTWPLSELARTRFQTDPKICLYLKKNRQSIGQRSSCNSGWGKSGTAGFECGCVSVYVCAGRLCAWASVRMSICMCMCMGVCVHVHEHEHDHDHEQLTKARGALSDPHMRCAFTHARGARARALTQILAADGKQCCG